MGIQRTQAVIILRMEVKKLVKKKRVRNTAISIFTLLMIVFIWWLVTDGLHLVASSAMASPVKVVQTFFQKMTDKSPDGATLLQHTLASLKIAMVGYFLAVIIGVPLGIFMAWIKVVDLMVRPIFDLIRTIPGIAWISLLIIVFGVGNTSRYIVVFLAAVVPCILNSFSGIKQTKDVHLWVGQTFGAGSRQLLWSVAIPTALPMIMTGVKVALGASWMTIVAAELLASSRGLGFMIQQGRGIYRPDIIMVGMVVIGIIGGIMAKVLDLISKAIIKGR